MHLWMVQVLGGTGYIGNWNLEPKAEDRKSILERCTTMVPSLAEVAPPYPSDIQNLVNLIQILPSAAAHTPLGAIQSLAFNVWGIFFCMEHQFFNTWRDAPRKLV